MPAKRRKLNMTGRKRFHIPGASSEEELIQDLNNGTGICISSLKSEHLKRYLGQIYIEEQNLSC